MPEITFTAYPIDDPEHPVPKDRQVMLFGAGRWSDGYWLKEPGTWIVGSCYFIEDQPTHWAEISDMAVKDA
jgi:hypothetical protein